ncbi:MAG: ABC transporter ATP-binding protein [Gemmatimonadales bacterium]|nr:ABC transporter ATP-binding protein [Gemmatimonadales bacterium]
MTGAPHPIASPLLEARALERRFGSRWALRGVSLSVSPLQCHLVVGPNGAGKTTLLRLLAGLARPSAGSVQLLGAPLSADAASRRSVGLLSHQSHLYDDLTAFENVEFAARLYGLPEPAKAARVRLETLGLAEVADQPLRRLSRGMVQRVAVARAFLHDPKVLLVDEPFTGLDPESARRVSILLDAEMMGGCGVVLVSHDVHEAWSVVTHVHVLVGGALVSSRKRGPVETAEAFLQEYRSLLRG